MARLGLLRTEQDFKNFKASKAFQTKVLKIRIHLSANQNHPRFGFIVPKKVLPKAVDRNLIKRRLKAILLKVSDQIRPADVVFYPTKGVLKMNHSELKQELDLLFRNARLWKF